MELVRHKHKIRVCSIVIMMVQMGVMAAWCLYAHPLCTQLIIHVIKVYGETLFPQVRLYNQLLLNDAFYSNIRNTHCLRN